ncbi:unnamed protein product [Trichobilharzia regenti]|nr:unnamed protein product [Trichobilharzia regenti]
MLEVYVICLTEVSRLSAEAAGIRSPPDIVNKQRASSEEASSPVENGRPHFSNPEDDDEQEEEEERREEKAASKGSRNNSEEQQQTSKHVNCSPVRKENGMLKSSPPSKLPNGYSNDNTSPDEYHSFDDSENNVVAIPSKSAQLIPSSTPVASESKVSSSYADKESPIVSNIDGVGTNSYIVSSSSLISSPTKPTENQSQSINATVNNTTMLSNDRAESSANALFAFDLVTATTAACIQILTKSIKDMSDSESLLIRLLDRIAKGIDLKFVIHADRVFEQAAGAAAVTSSSSSSASKSFTIPSAWGVQNLRGHFNIPQRRISTQVGINQLMSDTALSTTTVNTLNNRKSRHRPRLAHLVCSAGLLVVVLESVGQLTQHFPHLGKASLDSLIDFLLNPSPVLSRLNRQIDRLRHSKAGILIIIDTMRVSLFPWLYICIHVYLN